MAGLHRITADLARYREAFERKLAQAAAAPPGGAASRLIETADFGDNPGGLRMLSHVPETVSAGAPLVVALHGCTQSGGGYAAAAGWEALSERHGFALLVPEQRRANNPNLCFNWFQPADTRREAKSIRDMVAAMLGAHDLDADRVFVTGLSAGGAMTSAMLAAYPEVFAGGAIVAGLPYGAATNVQQALEMMNTARPRPAREWGYLVRRASSHKGPWPIVSVWHGAADATVQPGNAGEIVKQWTDLHGLPLYPSEAEERDGRQRRVWRNADGAELVESHLIAGMAHGTPIAPGDGDDQCGTAAPFILDVGIASSFEIARFWGLTGAAARTASKPVAARRQPKVEVSRQPAAPGWPQSADPGEVIAGALRQAGLMKR